jgi:hypothetical protein
LGLGDRVRVLTRIMKKITKITGAVGTKLRDRSRSVKFRLLEIGRVARAKRRHGLDRSRYKGSVGMDRWVGLGVIADNVVNIGRAMEKQAAP